MIWIQSFVLCSHYNWCPGQDLVNREWSWEKREIFSTGDLSSAAMRSAVKKNHRKSQREAARNRRQKDPMYEMEESEIVFKDTESPPDPPSPVPRSPPASPAADIQYEDVLDMVHKINNELGLLNRDNVEIRTVCNQLLRENQARDQAINDLTGLAKKSQDSPSGHPPRPDASQPHPIISQELIDGDGNLRASDIGITWAGPHTFLHGVKVVGPASSTPHQPTGHRPATSTPYRPATSTPYRPATSTPYQPVEEHSGCDMFVPRQPLTLPEGLEIPDTSAPLRRAPQETRQGYRPAAPINALITSP